MYQVASLPKSCTFRRNNDIILALLVIKRFIHIFSSFIIAMLAFADYIAGGIRHVVVLLLLSFHSFVQFCTPNKEVSMFSMKCKNIARASMIFEYKWTSLYYSAWTPISLNLELWIETWFACFCRSSPETLDSWLRQLRTRTIFKPCSISFLSGFHI